MEFPFPSTPTSTISHKSRGRLTIPRHSANRTSRQGLLLKPCHHRVPPSHTHRNSWWRPVDHLVRLLRGQGLLPLWIHESASHCQCRIRASLPLQRGQVSERVPIISLAVGAHLELVGGPPLPTFYAGLIPTPGPSSCKVIPSGHPRLFVSHPRRGRRRQHGCGRTP